MNLVFISDVILGSCRLAISNDRKRGQINPIRTIFITIHKIILILLNKFCFIPQILYVLIIIKKFFSIHMYRISIYRIFKYGDKTEEDLK